MPRLARLKLETLAAMAPQVGLNAALPISSTPRAMPIINPSRAVPANQGVIQNKADVSRLASKRSASAARADAVGQPAEGAEQERHGLGQNLDPAQRARGHFQLDRQDDEEFAGHHIGRRGQRHSEQRKRPDVRLAGPAPPKPPTRSFFSFFFSFFSFFFSLMQKNTRMSETKEKAVEARKMATSAFLGGAASTTFGRSSMAAFKRV